MADLNDHYSPGWKYNHWELRGVPIRIELGPKDLCVKQFVAARRDNGSKQAYQLEKVVEEMKKLLSDIQSSLYNKAKKARDDHLTVCYDWNTFVKKLDDKFLLMSPFCGTSECEDKIKVNSARTDQENISEGPLMGAKSLCIPFKQPAVIEPETKCINPACTNKPKYFTLFGRSY